MRTPTPAPESTRPHELSTAKWIFWLALAAMVYFFLLIGLGTNFFVAAQPAAQVSRLQVWGTAALLLAQVAAVPIHRRRPVLFFAITVALLIAGVLLIVDRNLVVNLTLLFAVFNLTARTRRRVWVWAVSIGAACDVSAQLWLELAHHLPLTAGVLLTVLIEAVTSYGVAVPAGLLVRANRRRAELAAAVAEALKREQAAVASAAVATERTRMARELHDVAAYHLSGILLQSEFALAVLEVDPQQAKEPLASIRADSTLTWDSLREMVRVLRADPSEAAPVDAPPLTALPELIDVARRTHPSARLLTSGDLADLSPVTALACYRIVQESLSNARKYAPDAAVEVLVVRDRLQVTIDVRNAPSPHPVPSAVLSGGYGLLGMRERAVLLGGHLMSGPTDDGGWATHAVIPLDVEVAA